MRRIINSLQYRINKAFFNIKSLYSYQLLKREHSGLVSEELNNSIIFYFHDRRLLKYAFPYYYPLILGFIRNGYNVHLDFNWRDHQMINDYNHLLFKTKNLYLGDYTKDSKNSELIITDSEDDLFSKESRALILSPKVEEFTGLATQTIVPFFKHPKQLSNVLIPSPGERSVKVFFSGNAHREAYKKDVFGLMSRARVLNVIHNQFNVEEWKNIDLESEFNGEIVIQDWKWSPEEGGETTSRIPDEKWLNVLSNIDFFLAPPGIEIPFSHNMIEAMSVGAIPITNYGHLFCPSLIDGVNCLSFEDETSLVDAINRALKMGVTEKLKMQKEVNQYYERHLIPANFTKVLLENDNLERLYYYGTGLTSDPTNEGKQL